MFRSRGTVAAVAASGGLRSIPRLLVVAVIAALVAVAFTLVGTVGRASANVAACEYVLGFEALQATAPDTIGACVDNEQHDPSDGITRQQTSNGVLLWDKATNWTGFTDGYRTWACRSG